MGDDFPARLRLAMKALSISRASLASELKVDKSVVGRWVAGVNRPTGHNLANLSTVIAARRPGFAELDWDSEPEAFRRALGVAGTAPVNGAPAAAGWLPEEVLREAVLMTSVSGEGYEGFWRSTRPSSEHHGRFVHDRILIRRGDSGLLHFQLSVGDMAFKGVAFPSRTQVFGLCADPATGIFLFVIFNAVLRYRADVMDGLAMTVLRSGGGAPMACAVLMERTGMLSGDAAADDAKLAELARQNPLAPEDSISPLVRAHLLRDVGPAAKAAGGEMVLLMPFIGSMARGPEPGVEFPS
jgi:transcriptional regulator with XRE-family HTH domain